MSTPGTATPAQLRRLLHSCRALILIGTRSSGASVHVEAEIEEFVKTPGMIIPIDLDGSLREASWWPRIEGLPIAIESGGAGAREPDPDVISRISNALTFRRRDQRLRTLALTTASIVALMVGGIGLLALESRSLLAANADSVNKLADTTEALETVRKDASAAKRQLGTTSTLLAQERTALGVAKQEASRAVRTANAAQARASVALARASVAQSQAKAAEVRAQSARRIAGQQEALARHFSAQNLLSAAALRIDSDPAVSVRLAEAAVRIEPELNVRQIIVNAAASSPAWNRFPAFPVEKYDGELTPGSSQRNQHFVADTQVQMIARVDPQDPESLLIVDVDSGNVRRSLALLPGERVARLRPYARDLLVLTRPDSVRVFDFRDLASPTVGTTEPTIETQARAFDCAGGTWPCAAIMTDGSLVLISREGAGQRSVDLGSFPRADRVFVHPSGDAVLVAEDGKLTWIGKRGTWPNAETRSVTFRHYRGYPYEDDPLPWVRWGPSPDLLLVVEPDASVVGADAEHRMPNTAQLWGVRAISGQRQPIVQWDLHSTGLGASFLETDAIGQRIAWGTNPEDGGSRLQVATLSWKDASTSAVAELTAPTEGVLRGSTSSETAYSVQVAALSPGGGFVVVAGDTRGLSGTQSGFGTLESWNLEPLDQDSSLQPESRKMPIIGRRHARQIAYAQNGQRIAVLDNTGGVSVFKVRDKPAGAFNADLRMDDELFSHLAPDTFRIDPRGSAWLSIYGEDDRRIYDIATGLETDLGGYSECGRALAVERIGDALTIASARCALRLRDGKIIARAHLTGEASASQISRALLSINTGEQVSFFRAADLAPLGSAHAADNPKIVALLSYSGSETSNPNSSAFFSTLDSDGKNISKLTMTNDHLLEKWLAPVGASGDPIRFERLWSRQLPKSGWYSVRSIPEAELTLVLLGSNSPDDTPVLYQVRLSDGAIIPHFTMPKIEHDMFEVAAAGLLDKASAYVVLRLNRGGLVVGIWPLAGGPPKRWLPIPVETSYLSGDDVLGVQSYDEDAVLFFRPGTSKAVVRAISLRTGEPVWEGKLDERLPAPMLRKTATGWEVANQQALTKITARIGSGGGSIYDAITRIMLSPERIEQLTSSKP